MGDRSFVTDLWGLRSGLLRTRRADGVDFFGLIREQKEATRSRQESNKKKQEKTGLFG
jgi:hypothetical protein